MIRKLACAALAAALFLTASCTKTTDTVVGEKPTVAAADRRMCQGARCRNSAARAGLRLVGGGELAPGRELAVAVAGIGVERHDVLVVAILPPR